jgi:hypothetical protein
VTSDQETATRLDYEVSWQVFGHRTVAAESPEDAQRQVDEWLEDEHGMDKSIVDGWDYEVSG